jgi:LysR family transcriptional activator of nhaA
MPLNYHHLRLFRAVAHDGNLTRAAERLNLSQSALSVQIRKLEESLGHALFDRQGRELRLTEAGRIALDHADAIFATGEQLLGTLAQTGDQRPRLRVGVLATLSRNFVIGFLRPILGENVDVVLRSGGSELLPELAALNLDVVLTNAPVQGDGFISTPLAEQPVSLVGTAVRLGGERDLAALLSAHPLVLPAPESGVRVGINALLERLGVRPAIAAEIDDMAMMRLLAIEDIGLAVLPPIVVTDELRSGRLSEVQQLPGISETFHAVTVPRRFPHPLLAPLLGTQ